MKKKQTIAIGSFIIVAAAITIMLIFNDEPAEKSNLKGTISNSEELLNQRGICVEDIYPPRPGIVQVNNKLYIAENRLDQTNINRGDNIQIIKIIANQHDSVERVFVRKTEY
jgi:hypothetical protein